MDPRTFRLAVLRVAGERFDFRPAAPLEFAIDVNGEAQLQLVWHFEEASSEREGFRLRFEVALDGEPTRVEETTVSDRPLAKDDVWGTLHVPVRFARRGETKGTFRVHATYARQSWGGATPAAVHELNETRAFVVKVR